MLVGVLLKPTLLLTQLLGLLVDCNGEIGCGQGIP